MVNCFGLCGDDRELEDVYSRGLEVLSSALSVVQISETAETRRRRESIPSWALTGARHALFFLSLSWFDGSGGRGTHTLSRLPLLWSLFFFSKIRDCV